MYKKLTYLSLFAAVLVFAGSDNTSLTEVLQKQQKVIETLSDKVDKLEMKKSTNNSASFSQNAYLPDIALIVNMSAVSRDVKNSDYEAYEIAGFVGEGEAELPFNKDRGFNLNYAELALHSAVDPYFDVFAVFHLHPDAFEIEEAYVTTRALPKSFRLKAGKFRSAFGRQNEKHQHAWSFDEQPIVYKALLGPDVISDPGIQLQWMAPTDTYIMAGGEALQGGNDRSFGDTQGNNLYVGYIKSSIDISDDISVLGGISLAHGKTEMKQDSDIYGLDLTLRKQLGSYSAISWQSEYLQRNREDDKQGGLYSQVVYQHNNNYSMGVRYEDISKNETDLTAYSGIDTDNLQKYTAMLQYKPFPFSRLRLEYSHDETKIINGQRRDNDTVILSLNIAAGAHGAHAY